MDISMEEQTNGTFWGHVQFSFFPDHCSLKFLKMKCNPTNKKTVALFCCVTHYSTIHFQFDLILNDVFH